MRWIGKIKDPNIDFFIFKTGLHPTLKQELLNGSRVQPVAHGRGIVVGATVVGGAPSASCLQMYLVLLLHGSTSHRPEKMPVLKATQPCWWPDVETRVEL